MQEAGVIFDYLESLAAALSFDRSLSRGVRQEVEDHLREAVDADPTGDRHEAERRAIANFGDVHAIAAQFAVISLARQIKRVGIAIILLIAGVLVTMKVRVEWYAVTQWTIGGNVKVVSAAVGLIDRYSFLSSVVIGIAGWVYLNSHRIFPILDPQSRKQLRRSFLMYLAATISLALSVISDAVLTALHLCGTDFSVSSLVPIFSMAIEVVGVTIIAFQIRFIVRRATITTTLLNT